MTKRERDFIITTVNESLMENGIDEVMEAISAALHEFQSYCREVGDTDWVGRAQDYQTAITDVLNEDDQSDGNDDLATALGGDE